jgi:hypothetical protein
MRQEGIEGSGGTSMAYSDFTLATVQKQFRLTICEVRDAFATIPEISVSDFLQATLDENVPLALAIQTEKARSELIIAPILVELRKLMDRRISLFSGVDFTVDPEQGLNGVCDFIITQSPHQLLLTTPVLMLVEAKNENMKAGIAQCLAEMVAAQRFNASEGNASIRVSGAVTTGSNWKFLQLQETEVTVDQREYYIDRVGKILAVLRYLVNV